MAEAVIKYGLYQGVRCNSLKIEKDEEEKSNINILLQRVSGWCEEIK